MDISRVRIIVLLFCAYSPACATDEPTFATLALAQNFVSRMPESPAPDNKNPLDPDFTSFYLEQQPGFFKKMIHSIRSFFGAPPANWHFEDFKNLLESVTNARAKNIQQTVTIAAQPHMKIIVFGDVQGALHSVVRDLQELQRQNIIDNNFQLTNEHYYILFLGDVINRSAYDLETLTLVLRLMEKNPHNIIYLQGNHEANSHWQNFVSTIHKLKMVTHQSFYEYESIPLQPELDAFFATLPHSVAITYTNRHTHQQHIIISPREIGELHIPFSTDISAYIKAESRSHTYRIIEGLRLLPPERGATTWTLLSCPTLVYQQIYNFFWDSFAIIECGVAPQTWTLTQSLQDVRTKTGFVYKTYNFLTGQEIPTEQVPHFLTEQPTTLPEITTPILDHGDMLVLGSTLDLDNVLSILGKRVRDGLALRFMHENIVNGGVHNKFIRLIITNDSYMPARTNKRIEDLLTIYKTDTLICSTGIPNISASLPLIEQKKIAVLFPFAGSTQFRKPELTTMVHLRASNAEEGRAIIDYGVKELRRKRFAIFYEDESYGDIVDTRIVDYLHKLGITEIEKAMYSRNTQDVSSALEKIKSFNPDAILFFATKSSAEELIRRLDLVELSNRTLFGISLVSDALRAYLQTKGLNLIISRVMPDPGHCDLPIVKEYVERSQQLFPEAEINVDSFEAYVAASLFIEAAQSIDGEITKEKILSYLESLHNTEYKGLHLNFDPQTRSLTSNVIWIDPGTNTWGCTIQDGVPETLSAPK